MAITPLEQYGMITRTQDYSSLRAQEETKENTLQQHLQTQTENQVEHQMSQVQNTNQAEMAEKKDGGSSGYAGDGGRNRKKKEEKPSDGKVVLKGMGTFDMKI